MLLINGWLFIICWVVGIITLMYSRIPESVLHKYDVYKDLNINIEFKPAGLKTKKLKEIVRETEIPEVKNKISKVIVLRKWGFGLLKLSAILIILQSFLGIIYN